MTDIRDRILEVAEPYDGAAGYNDRKEEYLDLLTRGDQEDPEMREAMALMSSCALFVRAVFYKVGLRHPRITAKYENSKAPRDVLEIARAHNALMDGKLLGTPFTGDNPYQDKIQPFPADVYYIVKPDGKGEHFGIVSEITKFDDTHFEFKCIDGGQGIRGASIASGNRHFVKRGRWWVIGGEKLLFHWIDVSKLGL